MRLDLSLSQRPELQLKLSPQLIQRIEILQLPSQELIELIEQELSENDTLEFIASKKSIEPPTEAKPAERDFEEQISDDLERYRGYNELLRTRRARGDDDRDPKQDALANTSAEQSTLRDHLLAQVRYASLRPKVRDFVEILIDQLDENGFLPDPIEELLIPHDEAYSLAEARDALEFLRSLDPPGVGSRNMIECFESQLDPAHENSALHRKLVKNHLEDWRDNKLPKIVRETGASIDQIRAAMEELRTILSPPPGRLFRDDNAIPIRPDVVVDRQDGEYTVKLDDDVYPQLAISAASADAYREKSVVGKNRRDLKGKIERARFLIEAIEQRKDTLRRVAQEIVAHQRDFFEHDRMRPLKMRDVADILGLHVSTVSRAISEKWMQTPKGIYPMKYFFTGAAPGGEAAGLESRDSVRNKVKEIIDNEDKQNPLSDEEVVERLKSLGLDIARRTVTKYRKMLNIPSSRQRRAY
jgi:RNA polymerase sigma-54 factor